MASGSTTPQVISDDDSDPGDDANLEDRYRSEASDDSLQDVYEDPDSPGAGAAVPAKRKASTRNKQPSKKSKASYSSTPSNALALTEDVPMTFETADYTSLPLKPDHAFRPLYISPTNRTIILEAFHPLAKQAQDFLVAIAEPVSRPAHIHEYKLTGHSLYAAISVGLETNDIIEVLNRLSKVPVPKDIADFIRDRTTSYGKVKLVLKHNRYFVESGHPDTLRMLLKDPVVSGARVEVEENAGEGEVTVLGKEKAPKKAGLVIPGTKGTGQTEGQNDEIEGQPKQPGGDDYELFGAIVGLDKDDEMDDDDEVHSFEIKESEIENVKRQAVAIEYPMLEEYDFRNDTINPNLEIDLKPTTMIRPYQEKSLNKMFGNG